ncbi:MAG TPA: type VII secretion-associated serine protease mycosin [Pseudonocardiaceae bacterium]|jgi:membrane-anchored mycosin MYCP|nr:type VII secretion-associated serine protease mycosin [Pseudonocardiaceae bacterium]
MSRSTRAIVVRVAATMAAMALVFGTGGWPAAADPSTSTTPQPGPDFWEPPAPNDGLVSGLNPHAGPDHPFVQDVGCIQSGTLNQSLDEIPPAQSMLDIKSAQQFSTGQGITVAVIDTGVNPHPFFQQRLSGGGDFVDTKDDGTTDCDGHGTLTAGIIAADPQDPNVGFIGVAPDAHILAIRQTSQAYHFTDPTSNDKITAGDPLTLAEAIISAVNQHVQVITTSVDVCEPADIAIADMNSPGSDDQKLQAAIHYAFENNVVVVNSAGNVATTPDSNQSQQQASSSPCASVPQNDNSNPNDVKQIEIPAVYSDNLLSVASVDPTIGTVSPFSEFGPWVNIAAPGQDIVSVDPGRDGKTLANEFAEPGQQQVGPIQGTSFAAPYVAGVVALVRAKFPNLSAAQVIQRIEATAQHPSGPSGRNNQVGFGIVDPVAALTADVPGQNGVPVAGATQIRAQVPAAPAKDPLPMRVALLGTVGGLIALLVVLFVVRTRRRNAERAAARS